jgi:hypothetical protein
LVSCTSPASVTWVPWRSRSERFVSPFKIATLREWSSFGGRSLAQLRSYREIESIDLTPQQIEPPPPVHQIQPPRGGNPVRLATQYEATTG